MIRVKEFINRNRIFVYISATLLSLIILSIITVQILGLRRSNLFAYHIRRSDILSAENRQEEALQNLNTAGGVSQSAGEYLMVLARARQLRDLPVNLWEEMVIRAGKRFPRNQDILALHINHLLEQDRSTGAAQLAQGLKKQEYLSLKAEAFLRSGRDVEVSQLAPGSLQLPFRPEEMADPQAMIGAGLITGDMRYFVNAVLIYATLGKIEDAFNILLERREELKDHPDAIILLKLAYDLGRYGRVKDIASLLPSNINPQVNMLLADTYFYQGELGESYTVHKNIADREPSGLSYVNQFNLVRAHGYAADIPIGPALETHRDKIAVLGHFLALEAESGSAVFHNSFNYYRTLQPMINLEWIRQLQAYLFEKENYRIQNGILSLWNLVNEEPENKEARDLLLYFLSLEDDREGILRLLEGYNPQYDDTLLMFHGFLSFSTGNRKDAKEYFLSASERQNFQASYNLGLFALEEGNLFEARKWFLLAAEQAEHLTGFTVTEPGTIYHENLLTILLYEGIVESLSGNRERALDIVDFLLSLEYRHVLLSRLKEMIAQSDNN